MSVSSNSSRKGKVGITIKKSPDTTGGERGTKFETSLLGGSSSEVIHSVDLSTIETLFDHVFFRRKRVKTTVVQKTTTMMEVEKRTIMTVGMKTPRTERSVIINHT